MPNSRLATNFKLSIVSRFLNKHSRIHSDDSLDAEDQQWKVMNNPQRNNSLNETIVNPVMYSPNLNNIKSTSIDTRSAVVLKSKSTKNSDHFGNSWTSNKYNSNSNSNSNSNKNIDDEGNTWSSNKYIPNININSKTWTTFIHGSDSNTSTKTSNSKDGNSNTTSNENNSKKSTHPKKSILVYMRELSQQYTHMQYERRKHTSAFRNQRRGNRRI